MAERFLIDPRLEADTVPVVSLQLCEVRLMNDARFPWLVLVPRRTGLVELFDLDPQDRPQLLCELEQATTALGAVVACHKLNIAMLGNNVRQLHIHVVARNPGDYAWPGPVWGAGTAESYPGDSAQRLCLALLAHLTNGSEA